MSRGGRCVQPGLPFMHLCISSSPSISTHEEGRHPVFRSRKCLGRTTGMSSYPKGVCVMTEVERRAHVLLGNSLVERGKLADAGEAFQTSEEAGTKELLVACGKKFLDGGWLNEAL